MKTEISRKRQGIYFAVGLFSPVNDKVIIITCFLRCWQKAAKYNHQV